MTAATNTETSATNAGQLSSNLLIIAPETARIHNADFAFEDSIYSREINLSVFTGDTPKHGVRQRRVVGFIEPARVISDGIEQCGSSKPVSESRAAGSQGVRRRAFKVLAKGAGWAKAALNECIQIAKVVATTLFVVSLAVLTAVVALIWVGLVALLFPSSESVKSALEKCGISIKFGDKQDPIVAREA